MVHLFTGYKFSICVTDSCIEVYRIVFFQRNSFRRKWKIKQRNLLTITKIKPFCIILSDTDQAETRSKKSSYNGIWEETKQKQPTGS